MSGVNLPIPEPVAKALELADRLGVVPELIKAIEEILTGNLGTARLAAETAAIKAAARLPYAAKGGE